MGKRTLLWILFVSLSAVSLVFTFAYFSDAFPLVNLDLQMDRSGAFQSARDLAEEHGWGPEGYRQAASFGVDTTVQTYVELEAGGSGAFSEMIEGDLYSPYTWQVRHFQENETNETMVFFTPAGTPYGFREKLPEEEPGAALDRSAARSIAETEAREKWGINLDEYDLIEESEEVRTGRRVDHAFVYEEASARIGEATYRLRLVTGGNRLTELRHFVKVPEEFIRSYEEMRSANDTIALLSNIAFFFLYILGGCVIGLFFLLRQKWVIWKTPLMWGALIGLLQFIAGINYFPIMWMNYDTAISSTSFMLQQAGGALASSVLMGLLMVLSFMAAESLTRKAFPGHIQFWRIWSRDVASAPRVAGYTLAGYLLVCVFFAYEVILYLVNSRWFGWWSPSDALLDPDLLAAWFPWLGAIANSAQAGFWEECLFRAVPLACAALLGSKFGKRGWWIGGALVLQAVIFGAGHANYPAQPAYARVVELIIPALGFGLIYLYYGLLPAIVLHYAYDVVWMSLPLFVSKASGIWADQSMVILLALVPLGAVLLARLRSGQWKPLPDSVLNASWQPEAEPRHQEEEELPGDIPDEPSVMTEAPEARPRTLVWIVLALAGFAAWAALSDFSLDAPPVKTGRDSIERSAAAELESEGVELDDSWKTMSVIVNARGIDDSFVWREGGPEKYHELMGGYLSPPLWMVRFATFEGDVAERAEEYRLYFDGAGERVRYSHQLPEKAAGAIIEEDSARKMADEAVASLYGLNPDSLVLVSSEPVKRDNRRDWVFVYSDPENYGLEQGEARIEVSIAGDRINDSRRFVFVPEEWSRDERSRRIVSDILHYGSYGFLAVIFLCGMIWGIICWSRRSFSVKAFLFGSSGLFILNSIGVVNSWQQALTSFSTAQPFRNQVLIVALGGLLVTVFLSGAFGLLLGLGQYLARDGGVSKNSFARGLSLGVIASGVMAAAGFLSPDLEPFWPGSEALNEMIPILHYPVSSLMSLVMITVMLLFIFSAVSFLTRDWTRKTGLFSMVVIISGLLISGSQGVSDPLSWALAGILSGIVLLAAYVFLVRHSLAVLPAAVAAMLILGQAREVYLQPGLLAAAGFIISAAVLTVTAYLWSSRGLSSGGE